MEPQELTLEQRQAIESEHDSLGIVASAGSGKTRVLIDRCRRIISSSAFGIDRLLVITFTEKAAAELKRKLRLHLVGEQMAKIQSAWIGTFHAVSARILRAHAPSLGLDPEFRILDENAARLLLRRSVEDSFLQLLDHGDKAAAHLVEELEYRSAIGLLEELMDFRWHAARMLEREIPADEREQRMLAALRHCFDAACHMLAKHFERMVALDFQAIEMDTVRLLSSHADILASYRKRFRHILVDEYQDTNDIQTDLVGLLFEPKNNSLFVVGDPRQSIYRFRGANLDCFSSILHQIRKHKGDIISLAHNFRSRPGIIRFINRAAAPLEKELFTSSFSGIIPDTANLIARRPERETPHVTALLATPLAETKASACREIEAEMIARYLRGQVDKGHACYGDIACLFQAMTATEAYEGAFRRYNIPYRISGGRKFLDRPEIVDLMAALSYAAEPKNDTALITLVRSPLIGLSDDECVLLAGPEGKSFRKGVKHHPFAKPLLSLLEGAARHRRPSEIINLILDETGYELFLAGLDPSGGRSANVDRLMSIARSLERESPLSLPHFVDFMHELKERNARLGDPPVATGATPLVRCMTIHAAKGLEFPIVVLPDLIRQPIRGGKPWCFLRSSGLGFKWKNPATPFGPLEPSARYMELADKEQQEEEAESQRLLYVAMTRAEEQLILPLLREEKPRGRWQAWLLPLLDDDVEIIEDKEVGSRFKTFVDGRGSGLRAACVSPLTRGPLTRPPGVTRIDHHGFETSTPSFTVSELETFDRCPQEYYLKHVIGLPAEIILSKREEDIPAHLRGSIIHAVLEELTPHTGDKIEALLTQQCVAHGITPTTSVIRELRKPLETFCKSPLFVGSTEGERELCFDWYVGNALITGKIDWLKPTAQGKEIIDFKTDRITADRLAEQARHYHLQMTTYALATEASGNLPVEQTTLSFLDIGQSISFPMDEMRREEGIKRLNTIIERISSSDFSLGDVIPPCAEKNSTCPYHLNNLCWLDWEKRTKN